MSLTSLEFGAFLTYCPRVYTPEAQKARNAMWYLKSDSYVNHPPTLMSQWIASEIQTRISKLPFESFFQPNTILVPTPKSSLMKPDTLWVPNRLATALVSKGLGKKVVQCLSRVTALPKAATCVASARPLPAQHYTSMAVQMSLSEDEDIVLIDDIVTRGATLLGAANRLVEAFPRTRVRAFAVMRTMSNPDDFKQLLDPCIGTIKLRPSGDTMRRP